MKSKRQRPKSATNPGKVPKLSRTHPPADLPPAEWQRGLRRQFGREQAFGFENLTGEPFFSEFRISNPSSKSSYRVAIRGLGPGDNFCSCPDYATSELGTCKHIEFTLAQLERKENKLEELISIVQFVDQHRLGPTWKLLHEHQVKDEGGRVTGYTGLDEIGQTLAPIMIRRRKSEVLKQLPNRLDQTLLVPMTEMQIKHHQENADIVARTVQRWRKTRFLSDRDQRRLTCALQNMRMSCNSTYLLDQETDHGVKADELAALFDDLFAEPKNKAVVFSQWTRTHDIIIRRLEARGMGYVSFHGGIPSDKRPALVERFRDDPDCRVFLSTDAGSTGLNLQHASTLVNMDLPWNPAVLEQRIARIHRLGQSQPVRVINFVAKGTIEEGMLSVLAFKRSLSAGILDGGNSEISLGGSRLTRFMKEVENVTGRMGEIETVMTPDEVEDDVVANAGSGRDTRTDANIVSGGIDDRAKPVAPPSDSGSDPWLALVQVGVQLASAMTAANDPKAPQHPWIERDPATGMPSLKIPLPPRETVRQFADALSSLAEKLRK